MCDYIYRMTGTLPELQRILEKEFQMEPKMAKAFASLNVIEQQKTYDETDKQEIGLWFMDEQDEFAINFGNLRFTISLTDVGLKIADRLLPIVIGITIGEKIEKSNVVCVLFDCIWVIIKSVNYIEDHQCCIYYQALKWKKMHPEDKRFKISDIYPRGDDGNCVNLPNSSNELNLPKEKWHCPFLVGENKCNMSEDVFESIFKKELCEEGKVFSDPDIDDKYKFRI